VKKFWTEIANFGFDELLIFMKRTCVCKRYESRQEIN